MDLLKALLVYMSLVYSTSVMTAPAPSIAPQATATPAITATAVPTTAAIVTASPVPTATPTPAPTITPMPTITPVPTITPSPEYKTLQTGSRGEDVKKLQRRLAELGYYTGEVDGVFGNQTRRSVERFQYYNGLSKDGIAGKRTLTILYESADVVLAPVDVTPSPSPSPTTAPTPTPTPAVTPSPTPTPVYTATVAPTQVPTDAPTQVPTDVPTETSADVPTEAPTEVPSEQPAQTPTQAPAETPLPPYTPVADSSIWIYGAETPLVDELGTPIPVYEGTQGERMIPFTTLTRLMGWETVPAENQTDAYSVTANGYVLSITYVRDESQQIIGIEIQSDGLPVDLTDLVLVVYENELFVPAQALERALGAQWSITEANALTLMFPPKPEEPGAISG